MVIDIFQHDYIYKRASFQVYTKYNINKLELWLLSALVWHLKVCGQTVCSKVEFFATVTGNAREWSKMEGYYTGLLSKGFIGTYEYISKPGSLSLGISDLGMNVLREYQVACAVMATKYPKSSYVIDMPATVSKDHSLPRYNRLSA